MDDAGVERIRRVHLSEDTADNLLVWPDGPKGYATERFFYPSDLQLHLGA